MSEPTLHDCINYMKQQLKGMEKYPKSYEFNIPYYRNTIEFLETRGTTGGNCATCIKAVVINERPHGEWIDKDYGIGKCWATCSECGESTNGEAQDHGFGYDYSFPNFCPNCGADMREEGEAE